jgi:hypothetical protein
MDSRSAPSSVRIEQKKHRYDDEKILLKKDQVFLAHPGSYTPRATARAADASTKDPSSGFSLRQKDAVEGHA